MNVNPHFELGCLQRRNLLSRARLDYQHASAVLAFVRKHIPFYEGDRRIAEGAVLRALDKIAQLQYLVEADERDRPDFTF